MGKLKETWKGNSEKGITAGEGQRPPEEGRTPPRQSTPQFQPAAPEGTAPPAAASTVAPAAAAARRGGGDRVDGGGRVVVRDVDLHSLTGVDHGVVLDHVALMQLG